VSLNLLHVKGTGEGSAVPDPAAIAKAVPDALGVEVAQCPVRAEMLARSVHPS
jgi:CO/xanthine dehydrogenase Mo-binding subunit